MCERKNVEMTKGKELSTCEFVYQNKHLISNDNFVSLACLTFHGTSLVHRVCINLNTLTDMHGAYSGVFL